MEKPRVLTIITSYNRKVSICLLVDALIPQETDIAIFDDHSDWKVSNLSVAGRITVLTAPEHRGKAKFWQTYNDIFAYCKEHEYDYYIILPDDVEPCPNFIEEAIAAYEKCGGICISPLLTNRSLAPGISRWGRKKIERKDDYYITNYFDCCTVCRRDFFEALNWYVMPIAPNPDPFRSSGVGRQITLRLQEKGKKMCHVLRTLLSIVPLASEMNPEERKRHPMVANWEDNYECVDVHVASLYRDGHLLQTLQSLASQPELSTIFVTLNNYTQAQYKETMDGIKELCKQYGCRIVTRRAKNQKGSNEKLSQLYKSTSRYIAWADDDIIYPKDYLMRLIHGLRIHNSCVGFHGGIIKKLPTDKYYNGGRKMYSWNITVPEDVKVDILGTGCGMMHRDLFTPDEMKALYANAPATSMDDIIVSCALSAKGIDRWVLAHAAKVIKTKAPHPDDCYVYDQYKDNDGEQVKYVNEHLIK